MDKITEALSKLLPQEHVKEVAAAVEAELSEAKKQLEAEFNTKLEQAYAEVHKENEEGEKVATQGYQEAYSIIQDLRNRLETQKAEFEKALDEGYEDAFKKLQEEKAKREELETSLYEEYDKKLKAMREFFIDKFDEFVGYKGKEIYEQAKRDLVNDPRIVEHKVALGKVVEVLSDFLSDEEQGTISTAKIEQAQKAVEELKGQVKILEARNIRISTENTKLHEQVRQAGEVIREHTEKTDKNERIEAAKNAQGRGKSTVKESVEVIAENKGEKPAEAADGEVVVETAENCRTWQVLSGLKSSDETETK